MPARLNIFSPLPPTPSDIANHTLIVARALREFADVTLWTPAAAPPVAGLDVVTFDPASIDWARLHDADATIFNIGNNYPFHREIHAVARRVPGLVVLHDTALQEFFVPFSQGGAADRALWRDAMQRSHGAAGEEAAARWLAGDLGLGTLVRDFPMTTAALDGALAAIVHNRAEASALAGQTKLPVFHVPLAFPAGPPPLRPARQGKLRLIVFGYLGANRCVPQILEALAAMPGADLRLDIYGALAEPHVVFGEIARLGLERRVEVHGFVPETALTEALARADLAINLRHPSMGEVSGSQLRIWSAGLPSVVSRTGWYASLPGDAVFFVEPGHEVAMLQSHIAAMLDDPAPFHRAGARGRAIVEVEHTPRHYALRLIEIVGRLPGLHARRAGLDLSRRAAEAMGPFGSAFGTRDVGEAIGALLSC
jgi:glycosyltransferase involved in cell wall biosynthesis